MEIKNMTIEERNEIIMDYLPTLKKIAAKNANNISYIKHKGLVSYVEQKELVNMGIFGLIKAIEKYEKSDKKISFKLFAYKYVDGSIKNEMTKTLNMTNYKRWIYKKIEKTILAEQQNKERSISYVELSKAMKMDINKLYRTITGLSYMWNVSLFRGFNYRPQPDTYSIEELPDTKYDDPVETKEAKNILKQIVDELEKKEKYIVIMHVYNNMKQKQICNELNNCCIWVNKLYKRALRKLKRRIEEMSNDIDVKSIIVE
jgi:RNA polymerase sigma factor (sigma-70 family)